MCAQRKPFFGGSSDDVDMVMKFYKQFPPKEVPKKGTCTGSCSSCRNHNLTCSTKRL